MSHPYIIISVSEIIVYCLKHSIDFCQKFLAVYNVDIQVFEILGFLGKSVVK